MTLTSDIATLCAAIDQGDDTALMPLADALEEAGDTRAAGLRTIGDERPCKWASAWEEYDWTESTRFPRPLIEKMTRATGLLRAFFHENAAGRFLIARFATRSTAFLALAEALAGEVSHA